LRKKKKHVGHRVYCVKEEEEEEEGKDKNNENKSAIHIRLLERHFETDVLRRQMAATTGVVIIAKGKTSKQN
jgi:hypothetical protein